MSEAEQQHIAQLACSTGACVESPAGGRTGALAGIKGSSERLQFAVFILVEDLTTKA